MVRTIVKYVLIAMVAILILMWLWAGGWRAIATHVKSIPNPVNILLGGESGSYVIQLPWQVPIPQGPDVSPYVLSHDLGSSNATADQIADLEREYESLKDQAAAQQYGVRSPLAGSVRIAVGNATESDPREEYIELVAQSATNISGWSVQSMLTGTRVYIPGATPRFEQGSLNRIEAVALESGVRAILNTTHSPIGVSFRETICTGYLAQFQSFSPQLSNSCPVPREVAPISGGSLREHGSECVDYIQTLPQCHYPGSIPASLPASCRLYIANTFSYNGCVATFQSERTFNLDTWRLYLNSGAALWGDRHDVIRLLDSEGRTVDVVTY